MPRRYARYSATLRRDASSAAYPSAAGDRFFTWLAWSTSPAVTTSLNRARRAANSALHLTSHVDPDRGTVSTRNVAVPGASIGARARDASVTRSTGEPATSRRLPSPPDRAHSATAATALARASRRLM